MVNSLPADIINDTTFDDIHTKIVNGIDTCNAVKLFKQFIILQQNTITIAKHFDEFCLMLDQLDYCIDIII